MKKKTRNTDKNLGLLQVMVCKNFFSEKFISFIKKNFIINILAYSIIRFLDIPEGNGLVKIRNPWGNQEWNKEWSDGSKKWTKYYKERLNYKNENDGEFWYNRIFIFFLLV